MDFQEHMNFVDILIILIYAGAVFKGIYSGASSQMSAFIGAFLGIGIASQTYLTVANRIQDYFLQSFNSIAVISYILVVFVVFTISVVMGKYMKGTFSVKMVPWLDHVLGGIFSFILATLLVLFFIDFFRLADDLRGPVENSVLVPYINNTPDEIKRLLPLQSGIM